MKRPILIALIISALTLAACDQANKNSSTKKVQVKSTSAPIKLKDQRFERALVQYLEVKNALVSSGASRTKESSARLVDLLKNIQGCENTAKVAGRISSSNDLKEQRSEFILLNSDLVPLFKEADIQAGTIFLQHCPMANNGNGAHWLAAEPEIKNPYYGDEMLTCGSVKEEFK